MEQIRRAIVYLAILLAAAWLVTDAIVDIIAFFGENRGIDFYREKPYLIGLCVILSFAVGFCIKLILDHDRSSQIGKSGVKTPQEAAQGSSKDQ